ncbi:adhesin, partial [Salmonella enterica subsp. enterica]|nr:adhesin [Salmonella enterica subsp. enterica]
MANNTADIADNAAEIVKGLNFGDGATSNNYALGDTINVTEADSNIETTTTSTGVSVGLADDISVESVTVGDSTNSTVLTSTANGLSVGGDKITNVAAGDINATSTDAVNGSQLFDTNQQVTGNTSALGGGASYDPATNTYTAPSYTVTTNPSTGASTTANNVGAALSGLNTAVNQPLTFAGDTGTNVTRQLGSILNVEGGAS